MPRGTKTCLLWGVALFVLACSLGCPQPTPPLARPQAGPITESVEKQSVDKPSVDKPVVEAPVEPVAPDDPAVVKALKEGRHKLKQDEQGNVTEATLVPLGNVDQTIAAMELVVKLPSLVRLKAGGPDVTNAALEKIATHKKLRVLDLEQAKVDDDGMKHLVALPLVEINLKLTDVRDDGVGHLAKIKTLKQLKLIKTKVTNAGIAHVKDMPQLEGLDLQDVVTCDNACLNDVKQLKKLKILRIYSPTFGEEGLAPLAEITTLRTLSMHQTTLSDKTIPYLAGLVDLEKLYLYGTLVTDQGLAKLKGLSKLRELDLRATTCGPDMEYLASFPELRLLDLSESKADDTSLKHIVKLKKLEDLNLWHTAVTDNGVALLAQMPQLKSLNLDDDKQVTDASMDTVGTLTNLEFLHLGGTNVTDAGLAKLHNLKNLKQATPDEPALVIKFLNVSDESIEALKEAIPALQGFGALQR